MGRWYFDLVGAKQERWVWREIDEHGEIMRACATKFAYYVDCVADAEKHGYKGPPSFHAKER
jgi:hypothetical protein